MTDDHDVQYGVTTEDYGTCRVCGSTAGWSEEEQRFVHGRTSGLLAEATQRPEPGVWINSPGEFAAVWNSRTPEQREQWLRALFDASARGSSCIEMDHPSYIAHLEREATRIMGIVDRINRIVWSRRAWHGRELRRRLRSIVPPGGRGWF